ncbi:DUF5686 and carboxypeptidase regulatory-like domain-containing protein [Flavobacterium restrictum]|uniref:Carboxypeptidase-like regulatory domain-containing protein n=1 Tax=Flavobacterium restrictum TaxID=2594428 RepID=A0A553E3W3_9FLAO|nr:DUF5686 and carboxypeptidase regulatory-like domain-containing protein [Flavobacterium restrictum]TRX39701.1 carboxypeptidase-like regulatory domain-containing protein [Flavobacterium restrictum]
MKEKYIVLPLLFVTICSAQVKGTITDLKGNPLPFVTVFEENTYTGTTSNEQGKYELNLKKEGNHTVIFQYLGYKTLKKNILLDKNLLQLDIQLSEESYTLNEVVINTKENPANAIIKSAIAARKENGAKTARFIADFYSRGLLKIKNLPKKILGMKVNIGDQLESNLDSTGTGILYLSETVSKITFEKPNNFKEKIIASKISGNDKGYSYNTAKSSNYDFYENTLNFDTKMISPIASNALNYYKYKLESTFMDENNQLINKVKVIAKRDKEPVFEGYIYIVEDSWSLYAVDLDIKGYRMNDEFTQIMTVKQNFNYNSNTKIWSKNSQSIAFSAGAFGIKFSGKFNYVFSNYEFVTAFEKNTFGNEIVSIETNANKKEEAFWNTNRPIPLTEEENTDYIKKDSVQTLHNSKVYLDSIDKKNNRFKLQDPILGYTYTNSYKKQSFNYDGLLNISSLSFNTVQGFNLDSGFSYRKWNDETGKNTTINTTFNYGFSENRLRVIGNFSHRFNNQNYAYMAVSGGSSINQFNDAKPISNLINSVSTLFFKNNFMKLYNKEFVQASFGQDIANGVNLTARIEYSQRKPLFNTTAYTVLKSDDSYTSNNPLDPSDYLNAGFTNHHLTKLNLMGRINFGNTYISRPDGRFNIRNPKYPTLLLSYEKAFAASDKNYNYDYLATRIIYDVSLANKGNVGINLKAGKFFNAQNISFIDYKHFNGNQTHIGQTDQYLNVFNLLPYYSNSTNDAYFEFHSEYNDKGFIMNKIPLLNLLKTNLILGYHNLSVPNTKPYNEVGIGLDNLGFGKFKMLRLDYVRSYQNGFKGDGIVFGLKFLNILE